MQAGHRTSEGGDKEGSSLWNWRVEWAGSLHTALDSLSGSAFTVFLVEASLPTRLNGSCITWPMSAHQVTHQEPAILQIARHSFEDKDVLGEPYISLIERVLAAGGAGSRHLGEQSTGNARLLRPSPPPTQCLTASSLLPTRCRARLCSLAHNTAPVCSAANVCLLAAAVLLVGLD